MEGLFLFKQYKQLYNKINYSTGSKLSDKVKELMGLDSMEMIPQKLLKRVSRTLHKQLER